MLNERSDWALEPDPVKAAGIWRRGQIVAVYHPQKPKVKPGMPRTVFVHIDDVPDDISVAALRWTLTQDGDVAIAPDGSKYKESRCIWSFEDARIPSTLWDYLDAERFITINWGDLKNYMGSRRTRAKIKDNDFTTGPVDEHFAWYQ